MTATMTAPVAAPARPEPGPDPVPAPHADRRVAIASVFGFWALYFLMNTAHMAIAGEPDQMNMMVRRAAVCAAGIAMTFVIYAILHRLEGKSMPFLAGTAFLAAVPGAVVYAFINYTAFYLVAPTTSILHELAQTPPMPVSRTAAIITDSAVSWYFFIAAWGVFYVALSYAARVGRAERRAAMYRMEAQDAQLRALRYQINPHFLFNTLNALSALVLSGRLAEAERMITNLADFFRTSLASDPAADVALADEIGMQRLYLDIEKIRFPERLATVMDVPAGLERARVPGMILQPLVENAIKHGVAHSSRPVTVTIRARAANGALHLAVEDNADGRIDANAGGRADGALARRGNGVGLRNVRDRLVARFDGAASLKTGPREGQGFKVEMTLPLSVEASLTGAGVDA
jgi:signal transduction histidine kinase